MSGRIFGVACRTPTRRTWDHTAKQLQRRHKTRPHCRPFTLPPILEAHGAACLLSVLRFQTRSPRRHMAHAAGAPLGRQWQTRRRAVANAIVAAPQKSTELSYEPYPLTTSPPRLGVRHPYRPRDQPSRPSPGLAAATTARRHARATSRIGRSDRRSHGGCQSGPFRS